MEAEPVPAGGPPARRWMLVAIPVVILLGGACICASLAMSAAGGLANLFDFTRAEPGPQNLADLLESGGQASFRLGTDCSFVTIDGSIVRSDPGGADGFAQQMPRSQAVSAVLASVSADLYLVEEGQVSLEGETPVSATRLDEQQVAINFDQEEATDQGRITRSIDGVVDGEDLRASYYYYRSLSAVIEGRGVEEATTIIADFACPLEWVESP